MLTRRAAFAALYGAASLPCLAEGDSRIIQIPGRLNRNNQILIPVKINGAAELWCMLDTGGSNLLYLRPAKAAELGIKATSTALSAGGLDTGFRPDGRTTVTLDAGAFHRTNQELYIKDFISRDDGIVGSAVFAESIVELDFQTPAVRLHPRAEFRERDHGTPLPIDLWSNNPHVTVSLTIDDGEPVEARMTVDSGAGGLADAFVTPRFHDRLLRQGRNIPWTPEKDGFATCRIRRLAVGECAMDNPFLVRTPVQGFGGDANAPDGMLAVNFLRRCRIFIDYSKKTLILEPNPR